MSRFLYVLAIRIKHRRCIFSIIIYYNTRKTNLESTFHGAPYCNKMLLALLQCIFWHLNNDTHIVHTGTYTTAILLTGPKSLLFKTQPQRCTEECQCEGIWKLTELNTLLLAIFMSTQAPPVSPQSLFTEDSELNPTDYGFVTDMVSSCTKLANIPYLTPLIALVIVLNESLRNS